MAAYFLMLKPAVRLAVAMLFVVAGSQIGVLHAADPGAPSETDSRLDALFGSHESVKRFLISLKEDSANKRWAAIAAKVAYPIKIRIGGHLIRIGNKSEFMAHCEDVLTPGVLAAIERQTYTSLFVNYRGAMIGDGEVWFSAVCRSAECKNAPIRIIAFNP
jgi:hypothetical protein